ncbi:MAG: secretion system protein, partial [Methanosarcinales archaeon]|nr:secretion system protein [Methanosarcinales archaeon]
AAMDAELAVRIKKERLNNILMYVIVVYISFFVFLLIAYVLSTVFLDTMPAPIDTSDISGATTGFASFDKDQYTQLLYHATLIQGFFSGLVSGQLGEGNVYSGLKHSLIMVFIGYLAFNVLM